ncbi:PLP-dependent transferase [Pantoea stewartii]|uniref:PLP-dependent transferase n=1 Tax=Pantoea stewartii TaxID=66269 RepID=UPI00249E2575|nr:PLP-dependent transferase [Pantoea stewartii]
MNNSDRQIDKTVGYSFSSSEECLTALHNIRSSAMPYGIKPVYARFGCPTVWECEAALAMLHGSKWCVFFPSGMSAIDGAFSSILKKELNPTCLFLNQLYPGTLSYAKNVLEEQRGFIIDIKDASFINKEVNIKNSIIFVESLSNPLLEPFNFRLLNSIKREFNNIIIIDNTIATSITCRPLNLGADLVVESIGKYVSGHNTLMAGAVFGNNPETAIKIRQYQKNVGSISSPEVASLVMEHLKTYSLRFNKQCENAELLAFWLNKTKAFKKIHHPSLTINNSDCRAACITVELDQTSKVKTFSSLLNALAPKIPLKTSLGSTSTSIMDVSSYIVKFDAESQYARISMGIESIDEIISIFSEAMNSIVEEN